MQSSHLSAFLTGYKIICAHFYLLVIRHRLSHYLNKHALLDVLQCCLTVDQVQLKQKKQFALIFQLHEPTLYSPCRQYYEAARANSQNLPYAPCIKLLLWLGTAWACQQHSSILNILILKSNMLTWFCVCDKSQTFSCLGNNTSFIVQSINIIKRR